MLLLARPELLVVVTFEMVPRSAVGLLFGSAVGVPACRAEVMVVSFVEWANARLACDVTVVAPGSPASGDRELEWVAVGVAAYGGGRPLFRANPSAPTVTVRTGMSASTEASGPKVPPVSHAGARWRAVLRRI